MFPLILHCIDLFVALFCLLYIRSLQRDEQLDVSCSVLDLSCCWQTEQSVVTIDHAYSGKRFDNFDSRILVVKQVTTDVL